LSVKLLFSLKL